MVMARKQVLVQLDDSLVERLDALATQVGVNRSELIRRGAESVLRCEGDAVADRALVEAYRVHPMDPALASAAGSIAAAVAPEW